MLTDTPVLSYFCNGGESSANDGAGAGGGTVVVVDVVTVTLVMNMRRAQDPASTALHPPEARKPPKPTIEILDRAHKPSPHPAALSGSPTFLRGGGGRDAQHKFHGRAYCWFVF